MLNKYCIYTRTYFEAEDDHEANLLALQVVPELTRKGHIIEGAFVTNKLQRIEQGAEPVGLEYWEDEDA